MQVTVTIQRVDMSHRGLVLILVFQDSVESWLETVSIGISDLKAKTVAELKDLLLVQCSSLAKAHITGRTDAGASWNKPQQLVGRVFQLEV